MERILTKKIVVVGAFPPPIGGAAKVTADVYRQLIERGAEVDKIDGSVGYYAQRSRLKYHIRRTFKFGRNLWKMILGEGYAVAYMLCNAGFGIAYNIPQVAVLRMRGSKIYLHHHSYAYIQKKSLLMLFFLHVLGPRAVHIFLNADMKEMLEKRYNVRVLFRIISSASTLDGVPMDCVGRSISRKTDANSVRVGYLSNLCKEKGFDTVVRAFATLAADDSAYEFHIAGAALSAADSLLLQNLQDSLGDKLIYHGEINEQDKGLFYAMLDIFVFPTRFRQEAQPAVIYEALAAGAAVVATRKAGIPVMLEEFPSRLLSERGDMSRELIAAVKELRVETASGQRRLEVQKQFSLVREQALADYQKLLDEIVSGAIPNVNEPLFNS